MSLGCATGSQPKSKTESDERITQERAQERDASRAGSDSSRRGGTSHRGEFGSGKRAESDVSFGADGGSKYQALQKALQSGKSASVVEQAAQILAVNPRDVIALNALGIYHLRAQQLGAAKIFLGRALEANSSSAAVYNNLGVVFLEEGDQGAAIANFKNALRQDDSHPEALGNLGSVYARGGDFLKALPLLELSFKSNRNNLAVANNYAITLRASGRYEDSARIHEEILKRNSRDITSLLNYSILLIDFLNRPKDGLQYVYKVKLLEVDRKDVLARANALEKKAKAELK